MSVSLELLRCPLTGQTLTRASDDFVRALHERQSTATLRTRGGENVESFEDGLLTSDGAWFYPIRSGIPVMLPGEAVAV